MIFWLRLAIALVALLVIYRIFRTGNAALFPRQLAPAWFTAGLALVAGNLGLQVFKWHLLLRRLDPGISISRAAISFLGALPVGLLTPGRLGEMARALLLPEHDWRVVSYLAVVDRLISLAAIVACGAIGLVFALPDPGRWLKLNPLSVGIVLAILLFLLMWLRLPRLRSMRKRSGQRICKKLGLRSDLRLRPLLPALFGISLIFVLTFSTQQVFFVKSFENMAFVEGLLAAFSTHLAKIALPISLGDLGIREGAAAYFFQRAGVSPQAAVAAALLLFLVNIALPALAGLPFLLTARRNTSA